MAILERVVHQIVLNEHYVPVLVPRITPGLRSAESSLELASEW